ncbi:SCP2 sterol-binding domain-containing protein [Chachezhania sediminis]|uniref:SCP2 sterol-binding domain-containing protein n=1 Tax=Chachezhania sediminis TaxID=2599291 RepID=UPI00131BE04E|nr:SCP2 sterol-binding domain-containing protein [Chachezhania sediminis]
MSEFLDKMAEELRAKLGDQTMSKTVKFAVPDEGAVMLDPDGVRVADEESDVTITADADTLMALFQGDLNPTAAFMTGKIKIDGDMGAAMALSSLLG